MKSYLTSVVAFFLTACLYFQPVHAQAGQQNVADIILQKDSLFWKAYNTCDIASFSQFFMADVEFYHDKGGLTLGVEDLTASMQKNLCGANNFRLRREAVAGSVKVFPLHKSGVLYGAILSGEHVFYVLEKGKAERLDGLAKFTHVWLLKDSVWKMARVLSYDHGPATRKTTHIEIKLEAAALARFTGTYKGPQSDEIIVRKEASGLTLQANNSILTLHAETANRFFVKERNLTFEFIANEKGASKVLVYEFNKLVEEAVLISKK